LENSCFSVERAWIMLSKQGESGWLIRTSLVIIAFVVLAAALAYTRAIMVPFVLAVLIYFVVAPLLDIQVIRFKFPRTLAVILSMLVVLVVTAVICLLVAGAIGSIISTASGTDEEPEALKKEETTAQSPPGATSQRIDEESEAHAQGKATINSPEEAAEATAKRYSDDLVKMADRVFTRLEEWGLALDRTQVMMILQDATVPLAKSALGTAFDFVSNFVSHTLFVTIFLLFLLAGRNSRQVRKGVYADIDRQIRQYVTTKVILSVATGVLVWLSLRLIGMPLAGVFGLLAFLLNFIPSIGSIISTLLPIPVAMASFESSWPVVLVILIPGTIQMVIGNGIEPKLMGEGLNLHPVTVLLTLSFWGMLWGVVGMLLAVPMTAVIRIVLMQFETLRPVGDLLAGKLPGDDED
jgi:AI-2 transport protein TqsA